MSNKAPFTVSLTIRVGSREYDRTFAVKALDPRHAVEVAEQHMPHLPVTDPVHSDSARCDSDDWLVAVSSRVVPGHSTPAWRWEDGRLLHR